MSQNSLLPFCDWSVRPRPAEPAHGYFSQLIALAGSESVRTYATMIDVNGRNLVPEDLLATISELPIGDEAIAGLRRFTPVMRDGEWRLGGELFGYRDISFSTRRRCPACTHEAAYHRAWWDIVSISRCPYHGLEIVDVDSSGKKVGWWWPHFDSTETGLELGVAGFSRELRHDTFGRYLLGRVGCEPQLVNSFLDRLPAKEVIVVCDLLGRLLAHEWRAKLADPDVDTMDRGYRAFMGGLPGLRSHLLEWMRTSVPHDVLHSSVAQVLGAVEHRTRAMPHLRPAINRVMREALSHAVIGGSCDMEGDEPRMWLTEAADRLGFNREGFYSLVHAVGEGKSPKKRRLKITEDQFRILAGHAATLMTRREVGDALGLLSWEVRHLEAGGYLRAVSKVARGSASGACYLRRDVDRILEHIEALATGSSGGQTVRGYARQNGLPGGQVAVAILDGELLAFKNAGGPRGFGGIRVTALGYLRRKTQNAPGRTLSVAEACALTNLGYGKVVSMLRAGSFSSGDRSGMLDCEAVENFARRYRPVSELAVPLGLSPDVLVKRLRLAGVSFVGTEFWVAAVADKAQAMRALDLDADPTIIVDGDFDEFWERLSTAARIACPQYKLPPYLPAAGQQVWRGDRKVSVSLRYRADKKEIEARVASGNLGGCTDVAISVPISDGPDALVGFLVTAAERERHTRFPPGSADATTPMTAIPNNEVPR